MLYTDWADKVWKVWKDWAESRNKRLLPGDNAFCTSINDLTVTALNFWISRFVLEIRKRQPYQFNNLTINFSS